MNPLEWILVGGMLYPEYLAMCELGLIVAMMGYLVYRHYTKGGTR